MKKKKVLLSLTTLVLMALPLYAGCAQPSGTSTTQAPAQGQAPAPASKVAVTEWHMPLQLMLTGIFAGQAAAAQFMAEQAAQEINAAGGISGKPVVLDVYDTANDPAKAITAMSQAIDKHALITLGPYMSGESKAGMPLAMREGLAQLVTADDVYAAQTQPWTIFLDWRAPDLTRVADMWYKAEPSMKSYAYLGSSTFPSLKEVWAPTIAKALAAHGVKYADFIDTPISAVDYSPVVVKALATGADHFFVSGTPEDAGKIVSEFVKRGIKPTQIFQSDSSVDPAFIKATTGSNEGIYSMASLTQKFKPKWEELNSKYIAKTGQPLTPRWYTFYDAVYMVKAAIEQKGITGDLAKLKDERITIRDFLRNQKNVDGSKFTYDVVDGWAKIPMYLTQIHNNEYIVKDTASN